MAAIKVTLKTHKEAIAVLEKEGFAVEPVRFSKGDHLVVRVKKDGGQGRITLAGSPSGPCFGVILCRARRAIREDLEA